MFLISLSVKDNVHLGEEYDIRIKILFVVEAKDGYKTEEDIDDFTKSIIEKLETNYDLRAWSRINQTSRIITGHTDYGFTLPIQR